MVSERPVITVVGLGPGDPGMVTRAAWQALCDVGHELTRQNQLAVA